MHKPEIEFIVIIAGRDKEEAIVDALTKNQVKLINAVFGRGISRQEVFKKSLGLSVVDNRVIMLGIVRKELSSQILSMLEQDFKFNEVNNGLGFTLPIEQIKF